MTYNSQEMQQILDVAFQRQQQGEFTQEQIIEIASELGVSEEALKAAEKVWLMKQFEVKKQQMSNYQKRQEFRSHLISFIVINAFLILLNLFTSPDYFWAIFPLLGWGIGLFFHWLNVAKK
ncbi:MAG: 2TM domain-containing protein [Sphaerospermopsis sp. SIO1G2]|nr:2TM domain-containing protein [Sphaerospermopsis sp. SIO1G1]NET73605.1 2TM domain-containing protein [Sphaerospermopsis sp. SIO1G2]